MVRGGDDGRGGEGGMSRSTHSELWDGCVGGVWLSTGGEGVWSPSGSSLSSCCMQRAIW